MTDEISPTFEGKKISCSYAWNRFRDACGEYWNAVEQAASKQHPSLDKEQLKALTCQHLVKDLLYQAHIIQYDFNDSPGDFPADFDFLNRIEQQKIINEHVRAKTEEAFNQLAQHLSEARDSMSKQREKNEAEAIEAIRLREEPETSRVQ